MGLEILRGHVQTVKESLTVPLRKKTDSTFALQLHIATATLFEHGLDHNLVGLLILREIALSRTCNTMALEHLKPVGNSERKEVSLDEINCLLLDFANGCNLNDAIRISLDIPTA